MPNPRSALRMLRRAPLTILMALAALSLPGCGTSLGPVYTDTPLDAGSARLVFYRPKAFSAAATDATLGIEQCKQGGRLASIANGSFFSTDVRPGKVLIVGGVFALTDREVIEVAPGEQRFYRLTLGGFPLDLNRTRVAPAQARSEIRTLREAPFEPTSSSDEAC